jgi:ADP-ribosylglycohydrolase
VLRDRLAGVLLGTALGDALGLPAEGVRPRVIARRFGRMDRFRLLGRTGFVSDDTEQAALVAESLVRAPRDLAACVRAFRRSLRGWFLRLPFGLGLATLRACLRLIVGLRRTGVASAGNGAAMRTAVAGVFFHDDAERRRACASALATVTHTDPRAVAGAVAVADLAAACAEATATDEAARFACHDAARAVIAEPALGAALDRARALACAGAAAGEAASVLGTSGFVLHSVPFAAFCFLRFGGEPRAALVEAIAAGGDTDSNAAIVGAWVGALHGAAALPGDLVARLHDGPFGPAHLRALAAALTAARAGAAAAPPRYSRLAALARNLLLYPVVLAHGLRRLLPPW